MHLIDATNAEAYLRESGRLDDGERVSVRELAGGVSNIVLLVEFPAGERPAFVLKQAREQLRVAQPWFCSPERIWREVEVLRLCEALPLESIASPCRVSVPRVLFEDRSAHAFAMTAAPPEAVTWKQRLMSRDVDRSIATACGALMATMHATTWRDARVAERVGSRQFFDDLRVDPYYRQIARVHPDIKAQIDKLVDSLTSHPRCLVHGDFSPKNLLVSEQGIMLIDCEVGHYGDPAFDIGFFLTHLQLKLVHFQDEAFDTAIKAFCKAYKDVMGPVVGPEEFDSLERRAAANLAACMLARVDGKSPVEYLTSNEKITVREAALRQLSNTESASRLFATGS